MQNSFSMENIILSTLSQPCRFSNLLHLCKLMIICALLKHWTFLSMRSLLFDKTKTQDSFMIICTILRLMFSYASHFLCKMIWISLNLFTDSFDDFFCTNWTWMTKPGSISRVIELSERSKRNSYTSTYIVSLWLYSS